MTFAATVEEFKGDESLTSLRISSSSSSNNTRSAGYEW